MKNRFNMRVLDLFAGIGGFSLAAHWMGWETAAFVEWEDFPQRVLKKNFPGIPVYGDIREFDGHKFIEEHGPIDIVCGGFPCQPFSTAGKRKGREDDRYLWPEMLRVIRETQPSFVVGENVAGLVSMDGGIVLEQVCTDLESEGYAVQPFIVPAIAVGAPHRRDRVWIVARHIRDTEGKRKGAIQRICTRQEANADRGYEFNPSDTRGQQNDRAIYGQGGNEECGRYTLDDGEETAQQSGATETNDVGGLCGVVADTEETKRKQSGGAWARRERLANSFLTTPNHNNTRMEGQPEYVKDGGKSGRQHTQQNGHSKPGNWATHWYEAATRFCRVDDGLPGGVDIVGARDNRNKRLKALGNAIVPQVAYEIFRAIQNEMQ